MNRCDLETALQRANTTGTMLQEHELCFLYALAGMAPRGIGVELGVYKGGSLSVWCGARSESDPVYAVDTWLAPKWNNAENAFYMQLEQHKLDVTTLKVNSWDAAERIPGDVAFLFVDSTHNHTGFPLDFAAWMPKIMPGGVVCFHDYNTWKPDIVVKEIVDAWHNETRWFPLGVVGSAAAFMRPRGEQIGGRK